MVRRIPHQETVARRCTARCLVALTMALMLASPATSQEPLTIAHEFVLPSSGWGVANAIIEVQGGGFAALGYLDRGGPAGTDAFLVRFGAAGDTLWTRAYGGEREEYGWDVVEASDGGFFIVGYIEAPSEGREDVLVMRVTASGEPVWRRTFGDPAPDDVGHGVAALAGGDILVSGYGATRSSGGTDIYLIRLAPNGDLRWWQHDGTPANDCSSEGYSIG